MLESFLEAADALDVLYFGVAMILPLIIKIIKQRY